MHRVLAVIYIFKFAGSFNLARNYVLGRHIHYKLHSVVLIILKILIILKTLNYIIENVESWNTWHAPRDKLPLVLSEYRLITPIIPSSPAIFHLHPTKKIYSTWRLLFLVTYTVDVLLIDCSLPEQKHLLIVHSSFTYITNGALQL